MTDAPRTLAEARSLERLVLLGSVLVSLHCQERVEVHLRSPHEVAEDTALDEGAGGGSVRNGKGSIHNLIAHADVPGMQLAPGHERQEGLVVLLDE